MNGNPKLLENQHGKDWIAIAALLAATLVFSGNTAAQPIVKKSNSGLCHGFRVELIHSCNIRVRNNQVFCDTDLLAQ